MTVAGRLQDENVAVAEEGTRLARGLGRSATPSERSARNPNAADEHRAVSESCYGVSGLARKPRLL
jgi:hypothetical protein